MEKEQNRREACLLQENQDLMEKLSNSDKRNDDLTQSLTVATKPLLRQIENLQSSYSVQSSSWEKLEKSLMDRLADAQSQLVAANEKERVSSENYVEISSRVGVLESQLSTLKQEKSRLTAELDISKMKLGTLEDEKNSALTQLEAYKSSMEADKVETKKSYTLMENRLELEKTKLEAEKKKTSALTEELNEKEQQISELHECSI
ncbi:TMF1 [Bugula neritina]|uniref:TMF1 n=1 Tax=Bugula neritina TaxID=10212 RepID=A0A7J7ITJ9_BUGNE|nr:TMF1 [Bugula neritina]